jgi:hypothetical protein
MIKMMIKKALLFFLIGMILSGCASMKQLDNFKCSLAPVNYKIEAPLMAYENNRFVVKVTIQGEDYNFLVSTGHSLGLIDKKIAQKLGYKIFRNGNMDLCVVPKLNIGTLNYTTTLMEVFDFNNVDCGCTKIDGYIGTNLMSFSLWKMDYPNEKIIIASHSDSLQYAVNKQVVSFYTSYKNFGAPIVNLSVNQNYYCDIAVASVGCFSIELPSAAFNPLADSLPKMIENSFFFEDNKQKIWTSKIVKIKGLTIGENVPIDNFGVIQNPNTEGYIGNEILHHFAVTFDWKRKQIIFASPQPVYNKTYCFTLCYFTNKRFSRRENGASIGR